MWIKFPYLVTTATKSSLILKGQVRYYAFKVLR